MTLDELMRVRSLSAHAKLIALWMAQKNAATYHRDEIVDALGLTNWDCEAACRALQHPDVRVLEGTDPCLVSMRADHPLRGKLAVKKVAA